ncbi:MAG: efflux RND transporter permease subunit, partial [Caulobacterales bacterium]|nr:efflux RND transporter permease subunit [Caulobacterales bacterium]
VRVPGFGRAGFSSGIFLVSLAPWDERERDGMAILGELNQRLGGLTGVRSFGGMRGPISGGAGGDVDLVLQGDDFAALDAAAQDIIAAARSNPNLLRVRSNYQPTSPRSVVIPDRERAAALGVSFSDIGQALDTQMGGRRVGAYIDRGEEYDVILQNRLTDRSSATDLSNIFVRSQTSGQLIPLSNLVSFTEIGEAASRTRVNRMRAVTVSATLAEGYPIGDAVAWFEEAARESLPADVTTLFLGGAKEFLEANNALLFAFIMSLLIVFLVLAAQFESVIHPFVIMLTVPLAVLGGLFGLLMSGSSLNIYSQIGLIILVGLAAKNGILIVEFANQLRQQGRDVRAAILEAAETRFRPIVMTGLSTAMGALPLVLASGAGAESRATIGIVVFAGVLVATLFTLLVIPVFYDLLARFTRDPGWAARRIAEYEA